MRYLAENGYTPIDLYDLSRAIAGQGELPLQPVIISIDDGYRDFYYNAFPILREFGFTATLFVVTEFIDHGNPNYVTWPMVEEMAAAGIRIEPHSKTHPDLRDRTRNFLVYELLGSMESVEARTGYRPRFFAYPGGQYDEEVIEMLQELHFWGAVTTAGGSWHGFENRFEWRRLRVRNTTTLPEFADLVSPGDTRYGKAPGLVPAP
jgi:peptidoglycan/xylan/chitin deacetylase (PgdA/CDA1 family)